MEEIKSMGIKNPLKDNTNKPTAEVKINELHNLIQGYFSNCKKNSIEKVYPEAKELKDEIDALEKEVESLKPAKSNQEELTALIEHKKKLIEELKQLAKKIEVTKNCVQKMKIKKAEIEEESKKNEKTCQILSEKFNEISQQSHVSPKSGSIFPRVSRFNFEMHRNPSRKSSMNISSFSSVQSTVKTQREDKENFFTSLNYLKLKEIEKDLDQITTGSPIKNLEDLMAGDMKGSLVRKVFKNFSINEYFDELLQDKRVLKELAIIQEM